MVEQWDVTRAALKAYCLDYLWADLMVAKLAGWLEIK